MEERYEIKGKIGQGGLGAVYRAQDVRMNREVAIKRILSNTEDSSIPAEGTRQLIKEAGALASLQHPNIVTIYDVGSDEDGPFVVMELISGHTLEDLIERGSFTWQDFRQLATQTLEALVAAQELHLVHRDLKPSNIMLSWLPSGKFQVKVVDFGLAKLSVKPSLQTIDQSDGVFGSIYFMAPEQFERIPIDLKADLYAIGCVFYYALTGNYPFDGDHAAQVMASHLQHSVVPLQEVREGIPLWACEWVMWHINRNPSDRPASAHESLMFFLSNDENPNPELSTGMPSTASAEEPRKPRLVIPGSAPVPQVVRETVTSTQSVKTASMPKPLAPPPGTKPGVHTSGQPPIKEATSSNTALPAAKPIPAPPRETATQPAPAVIPASAILKRTTPTAEAVPATKPKLLSPTKMGLPPIATATAAAAAEAEAPAVSAPVPAPQKKKALSNGVKMAIAAVLGLLVVGLVILLVKKSGDSAEAELYNQMISAATVEGATEVPVDERKLEILLRSVTDVSANTQRDAIYMALYLAKATDGTDVDARIAEYATTREMVPNIRVTLIRDVLRKRNNPAVIGTLTKFAKSTDDAEASVAAIQAMRFMASDVHFDDLIGLIRNTKNDQVIKAAEENAAEIISKSKMKSALRDKLISAYSSASGDALRYTMLRLLGRIGGQQALGLVKENLASDNTNDKIAAIVALGTWGDRDGFLALTDFLKSASDLQIRLRAYNSAFQYVSESKTESQEDWTILADQSKTQEEQLKLIRGMVNLKPAPWVFEILQGFADTSDYDDAVELALRAIDRLKDIEKLQGDDEEE